MSGIKVYSLTDLYGWFTYSSAADEDHPIACLVCGAAVANADKHQKWHNASPMNTYTEKSYKDVIDKVPEQHLIDWLDRHVNEEETEQFRDYSAELMRRKNNVQTLDQ